MSIKGILVCDMASRCGVSEQLFRCLVDQGLLPGPDISLRSRQGYSEKHARSCLSRFAKTGGLFRASQVATRAGSYPSYVHKLIKAERVPTPSIRVLASRFYKGTELNKVIQAIKRCREEDRAKRKRLDSERSTERANKHYEERRKKGFFSSRDVADMAGVSPITVAHHQGVGRIPKPKREVQGYFGYYYNRKEAEKVVTFLKERKARVVAK